MVDANGAWSVKTNNMDQSNGRQHKETTIDIRDQEQDLDMMNMMTR